MYIACIIKLFLDFILFASSLWVLRKISLSIMVWHLYEFAAMEKYMICHVLLRNMFDFWQKYRNVAKLNKLILKILQSLIKKWGLLGFLDQKIDRTSVGTNSKNLKFEHSNFGISELRTPRTYLKNCQSNSNLRVRTSTFLCTYYEIFMILRFMK